MLTDHLQQLVREAGGDALLLDARQQRGLISDGGKAINVLKNLRNAGFTRMIDFSAAHLGVKEVGDGRLVENFQLSLVLRAPQFAHAQLVLKWSWPPVVGAHGCAPMENSGVAGHFSAPTLKSRTEVRPTHDEATQGPLLRTAVRPTTEPPAALQPGCRSRAARLGVTAHEIGPARRWRRWLTAMATSPAR
jgi:hypothetical protein